MGTQNTNQAAALFGGTYAMPGDELDDQAAELDGPMTPTALTRAADAIAAAAAAVEAAAK